MADVELLHRVVIDAPIAEAEIVAAGLEAVGVEMVSWHDWDEGRVRFEEYLDNPRAAGERVEQLARCLRDWCGGNAWSVDVQPLENRDWAEAWREHFHAEQVSEHIVVRPPWETVDAVPGVHVIEVNPGMSFGTGQHPTTRGCLRFIDEVAAGGGRRSFLDAGCGSGILTIAAAMLGYVAPLGFDCDPVSIETSRENARINGVGDATRFERADAVAWPVAGSFDLVVANIYSNVLLDIREQLCASVACGGHLVLSGVLARHCERVKQAYVGGGLVQVSAREEGGWVTALFREGGG
jgi:ribosomal protein L11 methyltransferase